MQRFLAKVFLAAIALLCNIHAQTKEPRLGLSAYWEDPIGIAQDWTWKSSLITAGTVTGIGLLTIPNDHFRYLVRTQYKEYGGNRFLEFSNWNAAGWAIGFPVTLLGVSAVTEDNHLWNAAFTSIEASLLANITSKAIKPLVGRIRPYRDNPNRYDGGYEFRPFNNDPYDSFPSGHTTFIFALVTPWVVYYPHWYTYALYGIAGGAGLARLAQDLHWSTDILAGAILGTSIGWGLAKRHTTTVVPLVVGKSEGLAVQIPF